LRKGWFVLLVEFQWACFARVLFLCPLVLL